MTPSFLLVVLPFLQPSPAAAQQSASQSSDSAFQDDLASKHQRIRDQNAQSRGGLATPSEGSGGSVQSKAEDDRLLTLHENGHEEGYRLRFYHSADDDRLRFVAVEHNGARTARWSAEGLARARLEKGRLTALFDSCAGRTSDSLLVLLVKITSAAEEKDPMLAADLADRLKCDEVPVGSGVLAGEKKGDNRDTEPVTGPPGPTPVPGNAVEDDGEKKGDIRGH